MSIHSESIPDMYQQPENELPPIDINASSCIVDTFSAQQVSFAPLPPGEPPKPPAPPHPPPSIESLSPQSSFVALEYDPAQTQSTIQLPPTADGFNQVTPPRIICKDFQRGNCYRARCKYNHDLNQFLEVKFCHDHQNRTCTRNICKFIHCTKEDEANFHKTGVLPPNICSQIPNMPACNEFLVKGKCIRPNDCSYRHITPEVYNNEKNSANPPTTLSVTSPSSVTSHSPAPATSTNYIPFPSSTHLPPPKINTMHQPRVPTSPYLMTTVNKPPVPQSPTSITTTAMNMTSSTQLQHHTQTQPMMQSYMPTGINGKLETWSNSMMLTNMPEHEPPISRMFVAPPPPPSTQYIPQEVPIEIPTDFSKPPPKFNTYSGVDTNVSYDLKSPVNNALNSIASNTMAGMYNPIEGSLKRSWTNDSIINNAGNYLPSQVKTDQNDIKGNGISSIYNGNNNYGMTEHDRSPHGSDSKKMKLSYEDNKDLMEKFDERVRRMEESNQRFNFLCTNLHFKVECLFTHFTENKLLPRDAYNIYLARKGLTSSQIANQHPSLWSDMSFGNTNTGMPTNNIPVQQTPQASSTNDFGSVIKYLDDCLKMIRHETPAPPQPQNIYQPPMMIQQATQPPVDPNQFLQHLMKLFPNSSPFNQSSSNSNMMP